MNKVLDSFGYLCVFSLLTHTATLHCSTLNTPALIGGEELNLTIPYQALVNSNGQAIPLTGDLPQGIGRIVSVSVNNFGQGIIGGSQNNNLIAYQALVSPTGVASALTGDVPSEASTSIRSVAINNYGIGIIGGTKTTGTPYQALVSPSGVATPITGDVPEFGSIEAVDINDSGIGIIGGQTSGNAYQALVSPAGVATSITGFLPTAGSQIFDVNINSKGQAIIGGEEGGNTTPYFALVSSSGVASAISGATPNGNGQITSVAINDSGMAIAGGIENSGDPYVALISESGIATPLSGNVPISGGQIATVSINSSGVALVGGIHNANTASYQALVSPSGVATALTGDIPSGVGLIISSAINDEGVGLIGGIQDGGNLSYQALVSPSGVATSLSGRIPIGPARIISVSTALLKFLVPESFGPGNSFANSLFAFSAQALPNHMNPHRRPERASVGQPLGVVEQLKVSQDELSADASDQLQNRIPEQDLCDKSKGNYSFWATPLGMYAHESAQNSFPSQNNWIGGIVTGFDYTGITNTVLGLGAAYAFNYADLSQHTGHAKTNQEFLTVYGSWNRPNFFINLALWGGLYQLHNVRHSIGFITSTSNIKGWLLSPHLEISSPWHKRSDWLAVEPFVMFDWANNWQGHVREKGASGFNLEIGHQYMSLLRSEVGMRVYEIFCFNWGSITLMEKGGFVNKKPFDVKTAKANFVAAISSFSIEMFSNHTQNLGVVQFNAEFMPRKLKLPHGSLNYQGEFGSSFQSHLISIEIGVDF